MPEVDAHMIDPVTLPKTATTTPEELVSYFTDMSKLRRMEIVADNLYKGKEIFGFCHLYDGQEACVYGLEQVLTSEDPLIAGYRTHCNAYLRGIPIHGIFAEMLGKKLAATKGKGGSMHFYKKSTNYYGGSGIVGDQVSVGTGLGFALKYQKNNTNVAVALYGDGAANQGQIYESANMASIWKLPMIYICENNDYAMGTSVERSSAGGSDFHKKLYNVPGLAVDGMNVFAVREMSRFAKAYAIENGPIVMNLRTYRYHGHSMSDPGTTYRTKDEVQGIRKSKDPILFLKNMIFEHEVLSEKEVKKIEKEVKEFIDEEVKKAKDSGPIPNESLVTDVYAPGTNMYIRAPNYEDSMFIKEKLVN